LVRDRARRLWRVRRGTNESWQLLASVGYQFNPRCSVQGDWRYLAVEKEIDGRDFEVDLNGPILGATFRF
jgi:hypothetical protein